MFRRAIASLLFLLFGAGFAQSQSPAWDCPASLPNKYAGGAYNFEYKSWAWKNTSDYTLSHCIRNNGRGSTLFQWESTGISGFARPKKTIFNNTTYRTDNFSVETKNLWYGASPLGINVETLKSVAQEFFKISFQAVASKRLLESGNNQPSLEKNGEDVTLTRKDIVTLNTPSVFVENKVGIPFSAINKFSNFDELKKQVENKNDTIDEVKFIFNNYFSKIGETKIHFYLEYGVIPRENPRKYWVSSAIDQVDAELYGFRIEDSELHSQLFGAPEVVWIQNGTPVIISDTFRTDQVSKNANFFKTNNKIIFTSSISVDNDQNQLFSRKSTSLLILSGRGYVVSRVPIEYFSFSKSETR